MRYLSLVFFILATVCNGCQVPTTTKITPEAAQQGRELFAAYNCASCHSVTGDMMYGPALNNILNSDLEVIRAGLKQTVQVDRNYLIRSIKDPDFEKVMEYSNRTMPVPVMKKKDLERIVDYIIYLNLNPGQRQASGVQ